MWPGSGTHMAWMGLSWMLGLAVVTLLVWVVARASGLGFGAHDAPEEILKRRYARGEIDRDEFTRRLNDIRD